MRLRAPRTAGSRRLLSTGLVLAAALGVVQFSRPVREAPRPFAPSPQPAAPSRDAFGTSGEVKLRLALPGEVVQYPLEVRVDPAELSYQWVRLGDQRPADSARSLAGAELRAPALPGYYQLALLHGSERHVLDGITVGVLVPFGEKQGQELNGYRIGTYREERASRPGRDAPLPGFLEVSPQLVDLPVTTHLRLGDFMARDREEGWPRYVALQPQLLDKVELVMRQLAEWRGDSVPARLALDVSSGFRSPAYNRRVPRAARDSRHQYGDAADLAIDADGDGRITTADVRLVARAVDAVERAHPDLVGGLGLYTGRRYRRPYVHIDARGSRARWGS